MRAWKVMTGAALLAAMPGRVHVSLGEAQVQLAGYVPVTGSMPAGNSTSAMPSVLALRPMFLTVRL